MSDPPRPASIADAAERRALLLILAMAFVLRAGLAILDPSIAQLDEIYQYQEPAHKLLTGLGIPTWEWTEHVRSWLIPGLVLPVMAGVRLISDSPVLYWSAISCVVSAASLPVVWVAFAWGREQGGREGGIIAGGLAAIWFQLVYFSAHLLIDTVATDLLLPALYCVRAYRREGGIRALAWGSALLGIVAYVRPQLVPVLLLPAAATLLAARQRGAVLSCLAWGFGPLLALGGLDWVTLGKPFQSVWLYIYVNLFEVKDEFGVTPWYLYLGYFLYTWSLAIVPICYFCARAAKRFGQEFALALLIVLLMSLIGHKEPRFILPALAILVILTGVGIGEFRLRHIGFLTGTNMILGISAAASLALALAPSFRPTIQHNHVEMVTVNRIMRDPQACGIYFVPRTSVVLGFAGYTGARNGIRLYSDWFDPPASSIKHANYLISRLKPNQSVVIPAGFARQSCQGTTLDFQLCVYQRPGGCDGGNS